MMMKEKNLRQISECKDLMLSAAFLASGIPLLKSRKDSDYLTFVFDNSDKRCDEIEKLWWSGTLTVNAVRYSTAIKQLKNLIYSKK